MNFSAVFGPYGRHIRAGFYLVTPWETMYSSLKEVPPILDEVLPWFVLLIGLEMLYCWRKGLKGVFRFEDSLVSLTAGFFQTIIYQIVFRTLELSLYVWVYENWSIYRLPPDSVGTWLLTFFVVDFFYYWFHRAAHEVNILWGLHSTHHSSEYYNLATALRQNAIQQYTSLFFYLPQALFISPPMHLAHEVMNRLFQVWLHTVLLGRLGPLEWIINTPSHHRVHHGRNRYCIDKNYAGVLIIWDRMFGTFQEELESEPVLYGLTHNIGSYDSFDVQLYHLRHIFLEKMPAVEGVGNKIKALIYGPGWSPGKPRMGDLADIPEAVPFDRYHSGVSPWVTAYVLPQGLMILTAYESLAKKLKVLPWLLNLQVAAVMILSVIQAGSFLEKRRWAPYVEIFRCLILYTWFFPFVWPKGHPLHVIMQAAAACSAALWTAILIAERRKPVASALTRKFPKAD